MRYIRIEVQDYGYYKGDFLDPREYLQHLPELRGDLPPGAWAFASDPEHYDFNSRRCVKDLTVDFIAKGHTPAGPPGMRIRFAANEFKHDLPLYISYTDVTSFQIKDPQGKEWPGRHRDVDHEDLGSVQLDEILPGGEGCTHEIALTGGTIFIACRDLVAQWGG